jgi:hypothetical protein
MTTMYQRPQNELWLTYDNVRFKVENAYLHVQLYTHETKDEGKHILKNP